MIKIPLENYKLYQARLRALDVSLIENAHYVKWVRYYLDFEAKYQPRGWYWGSVQEFIILLTI